MFNSQEKVTADHLKRNAYLYIRQSTLKQVIANQESTKRQYDLHGRAIALGWSKEQIIVIDTDTGQSGAESSDRKGFQELVAEVGMGRAGIGMGLEVSRLARNCADWHRLIEICALAGTLILNEHKDSEISSILNKKGLLSGDGLRFNTQSIIRIRWNYKLKSRRVRLREKGLLTRKEILQLLGIGNDTLQKLKDNKIISVKEYGDSRSNILYEPPIKELVSKIKQMKQSDRKIFINSLLQNKKPQEVQYGA